MNIIQESINTWMSEAQRTSQGVAIEAIKYLEGK